MSTLTPEQLARIELNRQLALERRAAKASSAKSQPSNIILLTPPPNHAKPHPRNGINFPSSSFYQPLNAVQVKPIRTDSTICKSTSQTQKSIWKPGASSQLGTPCKNDSREILTAVCRLISEHRFTVDVGFHQQMIELFKTIPGRMYDANRKLWNFPLSQYHHLKSVMNCLKPHVVIGDLPKIVLQTFLPSKPVDPVDCSSIDISRMDSKLFSNLYPFQREGVQYGISKKGRCLIADDMGLGKTIQALGIADYYRTDWPLLIVCYSSMRYQWEEEIRVNLPRVPLHAVYVMTSGKDFIEGAEVVITSYDLLSRQKDLFIKHGFGVTIVDESHALKSFKSLRTKAALQVLAKCKRCILLSGTPALSRPAELFTQMKAIESKPFFSFTEYGMRYCDGKKTKFGWDFSGSSNMEELKLLLERRYMIRRLKSDVITQLPAKVRKVIVLHSDSVKSVSSSMNAYAKKLSQNSLKGMERRGTLLQYFAETGRAKLSGICDYVADLLQDGKKFIIFAHHTEVMDGISATIEKHKKYYVRIDGSVSAEERKALCDRFQFEEKFVVAVLSLKAANTGITLTAAHLVLFAELFWNPGELTQAEDRAHRIGQQDTVLVHYLVAKGTADDYLWPLIQSKLDVLNKAGLSKDNFNCTDTAQMNDKMQSSILGYFSEMSDDLDGDLAQLMDQFESVETKKRKLE